MNLLVIADDIGGTAPGIVYETILREISKKYTVTLICASISSTADTSSYRVIKPTSKPYIHYKIEELSMMAMGRSLTDMVWVCNQRKIAENSMKGVDVILSFVSFHHYTSAMLGCELSHKFKKKWVIYSVDAIPAPAMWGGGRIYNKAVSRFISKLINQSDAFFSSNPQMLEYQLQSIPDFKGFNGYIYTPIRSGNFVKPTEKINHPVILYTGGIYGPRKKESVINGFRLFLGRYPKAKLIFVGVGDKSQFDLCKDMVKTGQVELHGYTNDLSFFYQKATILLDINAYFADDVFLSSKIINYLPLSKPIISITGDNSPSRNIFNRDFSIIHCHHDDKEICDAFMQAVKVKNLDFKGREQYKTLFSPSNVIKPLDDFLNFCK